MPNLFRARVCFLSAEAGGRKTPAMSGVRPQLKLRGVLTSCLVHGRDSSEVFEPGHEYEVSLELMFWSEYGHLVFNGAPVALYEGSRLIARGTISDARLPSEGT